LSRFRKDKEEVPIASSETTNVSTSPRNNNNSHTSDVLTSSSSSPRSQSPRLDAAPPVGTTPQPQRVKLPGVSKTRRKKKPFCLDLLFYVYLKKKKKRFPLPLRLLGPLLVLVPPPVRHCPHSCLTA
jgi:hypothetical protein